MCFNTIDIKKNKERCLELLRSTGREGMEDMIIELEKMGYFTAPASSTITDDTENQSSAAKTLDISIQEVTKRWSTTFSLSIRR